MVRQFVLIEMARREMLGENFAAHLDGLDETLGARAAREILSLPLHHRLTDTAVERICLGIDAFEKGHILA